MMRRWLSKEMLIAVAGSVAVHLLFVATNAGASGWAGDVAPAGSTEVTIETLPAPEPPKAEPAPEPEPVADKEPEPAPVPQNAKVEPAARPNAAAEAPLPAAAQAGRTLTAPDEGPSDQVADFTMVQGDGVGYAGGTTASQGTSTEPVRGPARVGPAAPEPVKAAARAQVEQLSGPDRSRPARPQSADWNCSSLFPSDPEAGNSAAVVIVVTVRPDGTPRSISVVSDPGHGFGAAARSCALGQRFTPALDRNGDPTTAATPPITVRFTR
jgi:protein TonB